MVVPVQDVAIILFLDYSLSRIYIVNVHSKRQCISPLTFSIDRSTIFEMSDREQVDFIMMPFVRIDSNT